MWCAVGLCLAACKFVPPPGSGPLDAPPPDDPPPDDPVVAQQHVLFSEVFSFNGEFIELWNPSDATVDLRDYYLSDRNFYWRLPEPGMPFGDAPNDFVVRFPAGATIAPNGVLIIASDGTRYSTRFPLARVPDYTILPGSTGTQMEVIMLPLVLPGELLTNEGEMLALFSWDGTSDLVRDVDILVHGLAPAISNRLTTKQAVDGPDSDSAQTNFLPEPNQMGNMSEMATSSQSYKRIALEKEPKSGGNGLFGHDETAEDIRATWDSGSPNPTPGTVEIAP